MLEPSKNKRPPKTPAEWRAMHLRGYPGKIIADPELRAFVDRHLEKFTFVALAAMCSEAFGAERAPSKSAIGRYWQHFKRGK